MNLTIVLLCYDYVLYAGCLMLPLINMTSVVLYYILRSRSGVVVRALASHQCGPGSIPWGGGGGNRYIKRKVFSFLLSAIMS